jgi:hypothetical protein
MIGSDRIRESVGMDFRDLGARFTLSSLPSSPPQSAAPLNVSPAVARSLADVSLSIVREGRGPMRLFEFARRLESRLGMPRVSTGELCEAVKAALQRVNDPRVAILATSMPGVGYVYDAEDPDAKPVRASR